MKRTIFDIILMTMCITAIVGLLALIIACACLREQDVVIKNNDKETIVKQYTVAPYLNGLQVKVAKDSAIVKFKGYETIACGIMHYATHNGHYITYYDTNARKIKKIEDVSCTLINQCREYCINKKTKIIKTYYPREEIQIILSK